MDGPQFKSPVNEGTKCYEVKAPRKQLTITTGWVTEPLTTW